MDDTPFARLREFVSAAAHCWSGSYYYERQTSAPAAIAAAQKLILAVDPDTWCHGESMYELSTEATDPFDRRTRWVQCERSSHQRELTCSLRHEAAERDTEAPVKRPLS